MLEALVQWKLFERMIWVVMAITVRCRVDLVLESGKRLLRKSPQVHPAVCQITATKIVPQNKFSLELWEHKSWKGDDFQKINGVKKKKKKWVAD